MLDLFSITNELDLYRTYNYNQKIYYYKEIISFIIVSRCDYVYF